MGGNPFSGCSDSLFDRTTIPGVTLVDGWAVGNTGSLSGSLDLTGVRGIGDYAFSGCGGLTSVTIPTSVTSIGDSAFAGCSGLVEMTLPFVGARRGITGASALFGYIFGASSYSGGESTQQWFSSGSSAVRYYYIPSSLKKIVITDETVLGYGAFYNCYRLTSITIPDSMTSIGEHAFSGCRDSLFDTITIPGVKLVDGWAVGNTGSLSGSLDLTGVRGIGDYAFSGCGGLTNVTISSNITSIATTAFDGCNKLWTTWYRTLANSSASDGMSHSVVTTVVQQVVTTIVQQVESSYTLTDHAADRAIASLTVDADCAIDEFVLKNGEVYDSMLRIVNAADHEVRLTLPAGYVYETFKGVKPLTIPANSRNILTITRTKADTFLVSREELETMQ
jgi:hypothetical protein